MPDREVDFLLVGGGMASAHCASELRRRGSEGSVLLVGREPEPPYERPPISKEYLRGEAGREDAHVNGGRSWYEENGVELLIGKNVMGLDLGARTAKIQGGAEVGFKKALIGTVAMEDVALSRTFGEDAGRWFQEQLESHGVSFHGGETLSAFEGDGRVRAVVTESGLAVECDTVVVGAGVRPDAMLAQRAGIEVGDGGIVCDAKLETSVPGIYAAGDCCSYDSVVHDRRIHVEHWDVAMQQGTHVAGNLLGDDADYEVVPYFFSDLADWASLEYVGPAAEWDREVWRGDREGGEFSVWYLQGDRVAGCLSVGRSEELAEARQMIAEGTPFA